MTRQGPLIGVVGIALACLVGLSVYALRPGEALQPDGRTARSAPVVRDADERLAPDAAAADVDSRTSGVEHPDAKAADAADLVGDVATLSGVVVEARERPVAGAQVSAFFAPGATYLSRHGAQRTLAREVATDALGLFELPLAAVRAYELEVRADGFAPALFTECTGGMRLRVVLQRAASLRGIVVDKRSGDPVAGGHVRAFHGAWTVEVPVEVGGRFTLEGLVPGEVGLLALPERHAVPRYRAFEVEPGGVLEATLQVEAGLVVAGRITDARDGAPIGGAVVVSGRGAWKRAVSAADGRYRLEGVEAVRRETLFVSASGYAGAQLVLDPARADAFDVALARGRAVVGRVVGNDGGAVASGEVIAWTSPYFDGGGAQAALDTRLDDEGRFEVAGLDPALAYRLVVRAPGHATSFFPLASGEQDVDVGALRLAPASSIMGEVLAPDGHGVSASLELWPATDEPGGGDPIGLRTTRTDTYGAFAIGDLGPGRYVFRAVAEGFPPLDGFELTLAPGEAVRELVVSIPAGLALRGLVRDAEGTPVPDVSVDAVPLATSGRPAHTRAQSDARGWFELVDLAPVPHRLTLVHGAAWTLHGEAVELDGLHFDGVEPGGVPLELVMRALDARVAGTVVDADGAPVPLAYVFRVRGELGLGGGVLCDDAGRFELAVPSDGTVELVARRTRHLAQNEGDMTTTEFETGRDVSPEELGEARRVGVAPGEREVELRMRP